MKSGYEHMETVRNGKEKIAGLLRMWHSTAGDSSQSLR